MTIQSHFFPHADLEANNVGYVDFHNRGFYRAYNATTNPDGYKTSEESTMREHNLVQNAVDAMRSIIEQEFTPDEIDNDNDGYVDNICFVVQEIVMDGVIYYGHIVGHFIQKNAIYMASV